MSALPRTYGALALNKSASAWFATGLQPHIVMRLKQLFPRLSKTQVDNFRFSNDEKHCADLLWFTQRYPLEITAKDAKALLKGKQRYEGIQAELEAILLPDFCPQNYRGLREGQHIRPYQCQAIEVLRRRKGLLLGDAASLGKTYTAAGFMLTPGSVPAAVVVQTHLNEQWQIKLEQFTTLSVHIITGTKPYSLPPADVYIFKYSQLTGWVDIFKTGFFKTVVYDEVQELRRGTDSQKGESALVLSNQAQYRLGLSATPFYNYGNEIYNVLRFIDSDVLGPKPDFIREWCPNEDAVTQPEALGSYLREQHVLLRRSKSDVGLQLPVVSSIVENVSTDPAALQSITELARTLAMRAIGGAVMERGSAARELDLLARHATGVGKARSVAAYAKMILESGESMILVGWHRDVYDIWNHELAVYEPAMYTGSESPRQKAESERRFVSGETKLLILSLRSGAGIDGLQFCCSTVVFGELDWSSMIHQQIIWRLDREGQTQPVTAVYLNSDEGSDPPMVDLLAVKANQSTAIMDPGVKVPEVAKDASRLKLLARRFLSAADIKAAESQAAALMSAAAEVKDQFPSFKAPVVPAT